jgi:hypothetical protein
MNLRIVGILAGVALAATACGGVAHTEDPNAAPSGATLSSTPTPTPMPSPTAAPMNRVATFNLASAGGYTETATLDVGKLQRFSPNLRNGSLVAGSVCTIDPQKDAVAPMQLTVTETTPGGFSKGQSISLKLAPTSPFSDHYQMDVEEYVTPPECNKPDPTSEDWTHLGVGQTVGSRTSSTVAFLVIHDFYTPAQPNGGSPTNLGAQVESLGTTAPGGDFWTNVVVSGQQTGNPQPLFVSSDSVVPSASASVETTPTTVIMQAVWTETSSNDKVAFCTRFRADPNSNAPIRTLVANSSYANRAPELAYDRVTFEFFTDKCKK